jgi:DNA-binding GntR family transcriptional regulator
MATRAVPANRSMICVAVTLKLIQDEGLVVAKHGRGVYVLAVWAG